MNLFELCNIEIWGVASSFNILLAPKGDDTLFGASGMLRLLGLLFLFCLILVGAIYATKLVAKCSVGIHNNNIKVIETYRISTTSAIQIIRVADKFLAVSICKDNISLLATLDENSVIVPSADAQLQGIDFSELLLKAKDKIKKK